MSHGHGKEGTNKLYPLVLGAIGVVFGDIGTSPLYTVREAFDPKYGLATDHANVLGILSLVFWVMTLVVTIKYVNVIMSTAFARRLRKRKLKSDINVVPYIDVMLVLLVIFMITAPLLNLGVDIDLPQSNAKAMESKKDPVTIIIGKDGSYQLKLPDQGAQSVDLPTLGAKVKALADANPDVVVILAGDVDVPYGTVAAAMNYVSAAGVERISLLSKPPEGK